MIKIFNANDRNFSTAGNIIIEPTKCREFKKKSLNGWYIEVEMPIKYKDYIEKDKLCVVKTKSKLNPQAFRIADNIQYTSKKISFTAEHVMFDARNYLLIDVRPTNLNGINTLNYINERTDNVSPFTMFSNIENVNTAYFIRKNLLEAWAIIEERWNGVFDADNWNISFLQSVGNDNGETIIYGKNMQSMEIFEDWSSVVTKLYPVGYDGLMLPEQYLESDVQYEIPYTRTIDFQTDLEQEEQTEENLINELRENALKYLEENKYPKVSYTTVSNINDDMEVGDLIQVLHPLVSIKTEVLEYEYDIISKKIKSLTFGNFSRDVKAKFDNIKSSIDKISQVLSKQEITIKNQTELINSLNKNGYVYIDDNEILILDKLPKEEAKNVWRFGLGGIGFSSNGYEGPFEIAITMDGQINANFITTGTMSVSRIEGLANFISDTEKQISEIEIEQGKITSKVYSVETQVTNITNTQGEAEGKNIHIDDSSEEPFVEISLHGESTQKTRSGKNLFDISKYVDTSLWEKTTNYFMFTPILNEDIPKFKNVLSGRMVLKGTAQNLVFGLTSEKTTPTKKLRILNNGTLQNTSYDFKNADNIYLAIGNGNMISSDKSEIGLIFNNYNIQIEQGTTATEYEQYGASPSPDYRSPIENIEGKNKFDYESAINVENLTYNNTYAFFEIKNIKPNTAYTISNLKLTDLTNLGYSVYAGLTIGNTYSTGPGKAFYPCIHKNVYKNGIGVVTGYSDTKANGGKLYFCIATTNTNEDLAYERFIKICSMVFDKAQIEEGSVATPYVPYNSLEFKVEGKNRFDKEASYIFKTNNVDKIVLDTGVRIQSTATYTTNATNFYVVKLGNITDYLGKTIRIKTTALLSSDTLKAMFYLGTCTDDGTSRKLMKTGTLAKGVSGEIFVSTTISSEQGDMYDNLMIALYSTGGTPISSGDYIDYNELIVTADDEDMTYEPYKSQVATFPLGNQKLMEGSYLDDEGIHHIRKKVVLDGTETGWYTLANQTGTNTSYFCIVKSDMKKASTLICDKFINRDVWNTDEEAIQSIIDNYIILRINTSRASTVAELKTWLSEHPITVEYELSEEETVPYTAEQQEAWDKIEQLHTYKNVTNITSDAYAKVIYMRDNGLDVYETKQNAEKNYTETTKKLAEQKITVDGIVSEVSETKSNINTINNNLIELNETVSTTEQRVNEYGIKFEEKTKTINEELKENSETIKSMSYTFNTDELSIAKSDDPVNAKINNSGMRVYSYNELKAIFNDKGTGIQKLIVVGSAQIGNLQIVKATDENGEACTDFHHLVSNIQKLTDLEV